MIKGVHTMFYSSEPEALREFLRDKLGFSSIDLGNANGLLGKESIGISQTGRSPLAVVRWCLR